MPLLQRSTIYFIAALAACGAPGGSSTSALTPSPLGADEAQPPAGDLLGPAPPVAPDDPATCAFADLPPVDDTPSALRPCTVTTRTSYGTAVSTYRYDASGRVVLSHTHAPWGTTEFRAWWVGDDSFEDDGARLVETHYEGGLRRWSQTTWHSAPAASERTLFTYDAFGREILARTFDETDGLVDRTATYYDAAGRTYATVHGLGHHPDVHLRSFYANGQVKSESWGNLWTQVEGSASYDPCGRPLTTFFLSDGEGDTKERYHYDAAERLVEKDYLSTLDGTTSKTRFETDAHRRIVTAREVGTRNPTPGPYARWTTFERDGDGRLVARLVDGEVEWRARYDAQGRLVEQDYLPGSTTTFTYDHCTESVP